MTTTVTAGRVSAIWKTFWHNRDIYNCIKQFKNDIKTEWETFGIVGMQGFMLFMSELICWCHENGIPTGFSRGSCAGSRIAYVLDIIDINPVDFNLVFSRFCNPYRIEVGD